MIVKYLSENVWGYIDHVRQIASKELNCEKLIAEYDEEVKEMEREDTASYLYEKKLDTNTVLSNKAFLMSTEEIHELVDELNAHTVNLIRVIDDFSISLPTYAILLYLEDTKEYDAMVLITNQKCYLMNDEGKTIERLS
jgi:hypothetical protein